MHMTLSLMKASFYIDRDFYFQEMRLKKKPVKRGTVSHQVAVIIFLCVCVCVVVFWAWGGWGVGGGAFLVSLLTSGFCMLCFFQFSLSFFCVAP